MYRKGDEEPEEFQSCGPYGAKRSFSAVLAKNDNPKKLEEETKKDDDF